MFTGKIYYFLCVSYVPFTLQGVHPAVKGFPGWQNHLKGRLISSKIHYTTGGIILDYSHLVTRPCPSTTIR